VSLSLSFLLDQLGGLLSWDGRGKIGGGRCFGGRGRSRLRVVDTFPPPSFRFDFVTFDGSFLFDPDALLLDESFRSVYW